MGVTASQLLQLVQFMHFAKDGFTVGRHNIEGSSLITVRLQHFAEDGFTLGRHNIEGSSLITVIVLCASNTSLKTASLCASNTSLKTA